MIENWIKANLWDEHYFRPEKMGNKRVIYSIHYGKPLTMLLIDPISSNPAWKREDGKSYADTLFDGMRLVATERPATWFYITDPDDALSVFSWEFPADVDRSFSNILWTFELEPAQQRGTQYLGLLFDDYSGMFLVSRSAEFEIAFYGLENLWNEISGHLGVSR